MAGTKQQGAKTFQLKIFTGKLRLKTELFMKRLRFVDAAALHQETKKLEKLE